MSPQLVGFLLGEGDKMSIETIVLLVCSSTVLLVVFTLALSIAQLNGRMAEEERTKGVTINGVTYYAEDQ